MLAFQSQNFSKVSSKIRITGLNQDKTRKIDTADRHYEVYFELSEVPVQAWRTIFNNEWKKSNQIQPLLSLDVNVDDSFIVINCLLYEIAGLYFPALKKAVAATNELYDKYQADNAEEQKKKDDIRIQERKEIDDISKELNFD